METKTIQITEISAEELTEIIAEKLLVKIEDYLNQVTKSDPDILLTRQETANYFKVSLPTLYQWAKDGIINPIRIGNRIYFKKQSILNLIEKQTISYNINRKI